MMTPRQAKLCCWTRAVWFEIDEASGMPGDNLARKHMSHRALVHKSDAHIITFALRHFFSEDSTYVSPVHVTVGHGQEPFTWTALPRFEDPTRTVPWTSLAQVLLPTAEEPPPVLSDQCINSFCWRLTIAACQPHSAIPGMAWINALGRPHHGIHVIWPSSDDRDIAQVLDELASSVSPASTR